jgi:hypothetical protein
MTSLLFRHHHVSVARNLPVIRMVVVGFRAIGFQPVDYLPVRGFWMIGIFPAGHNTDRLVPQFMFL